VLEYASLLMDVAGAFRHHRSDRTRDLFAEALSIFRNDGGGKGALANKITAKKAGRDWHHHSRALRRQSMGQGG
jgi:hypothetical protein